MFQIQLTSGSTFEAKIDESLLDAATREGVSLAYSCKTGRCSTCKCKVLQGSTVALAAENGLSDLERSQGWILSCVRSATSDMALMANDLGGVVLPTIKTLPCRISQIDRLASDVVRVKLRLPPTADFAFLPGQYIDVIGPNGARRSYSLANADFSNKSLELHVRAVDGGLFSEYWFSNAKVNDLLRLNGPLGTFFLRDTGNKDLVFLATGTGIAPVKAMLESLSGLTSERKPRSVTVFWGGRKLNDLYVDLSEFATEFKYVPVLSRPDPEWAGERGYVQKVLLSQRVEFANCVVYACGSDAMIHSAKEALVSNGLPESNFYSDAFVSSSSN